MTNQSERLLETLEKRICVLDGAMGTAIQQVDPNLEDFGGPEYEGCNEYLCITRPDLIATIHRSHLEAGADIIETNTFGSTDLVLAEFGLQDRAFEITRAAAQVARREADRVGTPGHPRFVAGSMGPTTKAISVTGGITFEELIQTYAGQARALLAGGVDLLLLETCQDTRNIKAGVLGIQEVGRELGAVPPLAISVTIEAMGTMLAGQTIEALYTSLAHLPLLYVGLNCATGPEFMTDHIRSLSEVARFPVACVPNAGLPDEEGNYLETPAMMTHVLNRFLDEGWLNLVGGCCGTTSEHIASMAALVDGRSPRRIPRLRPTCVSGIENLEIDDSIRPALVGERTNVLGSRRFKRLVREDKLEEACEIARRQVKNGAHIIDVCLQDPDRDEVTDISEFLDLLVRMVKAPLMIDSTDAAVMEKALTYCQGKAILNSINLEDGEERFARVVPMARRFGAALVVGTIDEDKQQGMATTRERKLEVAAHSYDLLVDKYGVPPEDILFDPLVFPCGTGDENYLGSALETVEGVRLIKQHFPACKTILGVSNVSFGLPPAGREVLNSVFLYHCTKAGLDLAIVNTEKLERYASIPEEEKKLSEAILFETSDDTLASFVAHFRDASSRIVKDVSKLSLDERLANYVVEGSKEGLLEDLDTKLQDTVPLKIINGPLMAGMDEVGRLFNNNELIVAEVLQSAEAMKAAVAYLEGFMDKADSANRGRVILATVKGDVHDIGKNLVDIILSNNGYRVVNLGIKVAPHELIEAIERENPDIVGLSGLLVKSAQQMVITAHELRQAGIGVPLLVGGAALTRSFTRLKIAPEHQGLTLYAQDAMHGLGLASRLQTGDLGRLKAELEEETERLRKQKARPRAVPSTRTAPSIQRLEQLPAPPDYQRHVLRDIPLDHIWPFINPQMLFGKHLGLKGRAVQRLADGDLKALELRDLVDDLKRQCRQGSMTAHAVWQFFPASADGNSIHLYDAESQAAQLSQFDFPRGASGLCLADFVTPLNGSRRDSICLFAVTAGAGIRELYQRFYDSGDYLKSHTIQALAIETAEALAEWLHSKLRGHWGFPDRADLSMRQRFQAKYRGKRYSFGYPACPNLEDQARLWKLINPSEIGIELTEEFMMEPEASVSAVVFHHPEARYFSVQNLSE